MTDTTNESVDAPTEGDVEETYTADESGVAYSSESAPSADAPLKPATIIPAAATGRRGCNGCSGRLRRCLAGRAARPRPAAGS